MSKIKSAKEWNTLHTIVPKDFSSEDFWMIYDLAESYADHVLKAKLESVTDEEMSDNLDRYEMLGAKWLKQKLLKDE